MTQSLSPAAQAVLDAMHRSYDHGPTRRAIAAEVLRALVDQVAPVEPQWTKEKCPYDRSKWQERKRIRRQILAIAAELENKQ